MALLYLLAQPVHVLLLNLHVDIVCDLCGEAMLVHA